MSKKNKIILGIVIGILSFVVISAIAGVIVYYTYLKPQISNTLDSLVGNEEIAQVKDELLTELENVLQDEDVKNFLNEADPDTASELMGVVSDAKSGSTEATQAPTNNPTKAPASVPQKNNTPGPEATETPSQSPTEEPKESQEPEATEKPSTMEVIKNEVEPTDLTSAISLAGKVDTGYILGLVKGGITLEEKRELKKYLMERLSPSEISSGIRLFAKYSSFL